MKYPSTRRQTLSIFLVLLVVVGVGFFVPISRESLMGFVGKGILYLFVFVGLYIMLFLFGQCQTVSQGKWAGKITANLEIIAAEIHGLLHHHSPFRAQTRQHNCWVPLSYGYMTWVMYSLAMKPLLGFGELIGILCSAFILKKCFGSFFNSVTVSF